MSAVLSDCGLYRWVLGRTNRVFKVGMRRAPGYVLWVMLNPSTADAELNDPTINRVIEFSRRLGFKDLLVCNVYGLRATDPTELWGVQDPVGPLNDQWLHEAASKATTVIVGWGKHAKPERVARVVDILKADNQSIWCLGTNNDGSPKHPLYLKGDTPLQEWSLPS